MEKLQKLPDAEFEIMKVVWANEPPITSRIVMDQLGRHKNWKAPTIISLMQRLVERGFLRTEKTGKERLYEPLVSRDEYLKFETGHFMNLYHENSFLSLVNALYEGEHIGEQEMEEWMKWVKNHGE